MYIYKVCQQLHVDNVDAPLHHVYENEHKHKNVTSGVVSQKIFLGGGDQYWVTC